jgi:hypothetical protein
MRENAQKSGCCWIASDWARLSFESHPLRHLVWGALPRQTPLLALSRDLPPVEMRSGKSRFVREGSLARSLASVRLR